MPAEATPFMDSSGSAECCMFFSKINRPAQKKKNKKINFILQFLLTGCRK
jgi:hypothetical protein